MEGMQGWQVWVAVTMAGAAVYVAWEFRGRIGNALLLAVAVGVALGLAGGVVYGCGRLFGAGFKAAGG